MLKNSIWSKIFKNYCPYFGCAVWLSSMLLMWSLLVKLKAFRIAEALPVECLLLNLGTAWGVLNWERERLQHEQVRGLWWLVVAVLLLFLCSKLAEKQRFEIAPPIWKREQTLFGADSAVQRVSINFLSWMVQKIN